MCIRQALRSADVTPAEVSYLEAHGTGTAMGDPLEVDALWSVLREGREPGEPLWLGSVKTNLGYPEAASGVVGMMKTVLALEHGQLPPHLHLKTPNPHIDWTRMNVRIPQELTPWTPSRGRRLAGVTSYGRTGTLAHVVLEQAPADVPPERGPDTPSRLLVVSARSEAALRAQVSRYERFLGEGAADLGDLCFTAARGRTHFEHRLAVVGASVSQLREQLRRAAETRSPPSEGSSHLERLAALYMRGGELEGASLEPSRPRRVLLPTYPFQRQRYWLARRNDKPSR